ncbi:GGDEF domain-containing protein [Aeromonas intestinalis]
MSSQHPPIPRKWWYRFWFFCLALAGLVVVGNYAYLNVRHDMLLIAHKQSNVFEVFYQRTRVLDPEQLIQFVDSNAIKSPIFSENRDALAYVYAYNFKTRARLAQIPLMPATRDLLATYQYVLSYPDVINIYAIFDNHRILGLMADNTQLPDQLFESNTSLNNIEPWHHYFGCAAFAISHAPCSKDEAQVSDIYTDTFTQLKTITMYFPFVFYDRAENTYRYGLTGIDIAVDTAFREVLLPYETHNPTRSVVSFDEVEPCRPFHICLNTPLMQTKAGSTLYLKWSYSYGDALHQLVFYSPAFKIYLIALLFIMLTWRQVYARLRALTHTDNLTRLPRRDILDETLLQDHDYLMLLDIDNFKAINDRHGHNVGDLALTAFALGLRTNTRKGDISIRWGGEEFVILFKGLGDEATMQQAAARLLTHPIRIAEVPAPITFSAGIIRIRDYLQVTDAVALADELLYHVKQHGKHNIAYYHGQQIRLVREDTPPQS